LQGSASNRGIVREGLPAADQRVAPKQGVVSGKPRVQESFRGPKAIEVLKELAADLLNLHALDPNNLGSGEGPEVQGPRSRLRYRGTRLLVEDVEAFGPE